MPVSYTANKAHFAAIGAALTTLVVAGLARWSGLVETPPSAEVGTAVVVVVTTIANAVGAWVLTYLAKPNQPK